MKPSIRWLVPLLVLLVGCSLEGPEERAIRQMVETFVAALDKGDDDLASACLLDLQGFKLLNPDVSARVEAESFTASTLAELVQSYRNMKNYFADRDIELKQFQLGVPFYQYKGHSAFRDSRVVVQAGDDKVEFVIMGIVRIGDRWVIVDLSGNDLF